MRWGCILVLLCVSGPTWAAKHQAQPSVEASDASDDEPGTPAQLKAKPAAPTKPEKPATPSLDFDLMDEGSKSKPAEGPKAEELARIDEEVKARRTMLTLHQGLGLAMLGTMGANAVVGQLELNDKYRAGGDSERWLPWHVGLLSATSVLFASVGLLGVLAPTPYPKQFRLDTAGIHKIFMGLATAGMVAELILGLVTHALEGHLSQVDLVTVHQIIGYSTLGAVTAGAVTLFF